jgi:hypothetical protein
VGHPDEGVLSLSRLVADAGLKLPNAGDFSKIINEVLQPLGGVEGTQLEVRVDIKAVNPTGFDDAKRRTVNENADTLRFDQYGFEQE